MAQAIRANLVKRQDVATLQLAADDDLASGINSVNLEDRLGGTAKAAKKTAKKTSKRKKK